MMNSVRTFVAVETGAAVRQRAAELVAALAATGARVSWVKPENMHLTLKFLDEVPLHAIPQVSAAVQAAAAEFEPFDLEICSAGAFPSAARPRTLWLGTGQGSDALERLNAGLERGLKALGFPKEHRRFAGHLTLGRVRESTSGLVELGSLIRQHAAFVAGTFPVRELVVFSSRLTPQGAIYEPLGRGRLMDGLRG
jgi:2'-5' RNA ligase